MNPTTNLDSAGQELLATLLDAHLSAGGLAVAAVHPRVWALNRARRRDELNLSPVTQGSLTPAPDGRARLVIARDLLLAFRRPEQLLQPLAFFVLVTALFPLCRSPRSARAAAGDCTRGSCGSPRCWRRRCWRWIFCSVTMPRTVRSNNMPSPGKSLTWLLLGKTAAHWLLTGVPLSLIGARCCGYTLGRAALPPAPRYHGHHARWAAWP